MTTRKRNSSMPSSENKHRNRRTKKSDRKRQSRRQHLLETLEPRQLLAGPQLIGIQPNEGALIENGTSRDTAPRVLTFGFDEAQRIDPSTLDGIRISRSGPDQTFGTDDDVLINPGLVTLGETNENEVVVRFAESLPDDNYRIEVFGFDDPALGIVGLGNLDGDKFIPSDPNRQSEVIDFELRLGALVEAVVPQPVLRVPDGNGGSELVQNRDEIVVFFNEDELFIENDANGNPTLRSAENPRFYQLLFTQETVRTTDDLLFFPEEVVYDAATHTARLIFAGDINELTDVPIGGGTWRLRLGTAVDDRVDLIVTPTSVPVNATAVTDFQHDGLRVAFATNGLGEGNGTTVRFTDSGTGGLLALLDANGNVVFDFGGSTPQVSDLQSAIAANLAVASVIRIEFSRNGTQNDGGNLVVPSSVIGASPLQLSAAGETLETAFDIGVFGQQGELTSLVLTEAISPQPFLIQLPGGQGDPGHTDEVEHINTAFGADTLAGVTEISYNFRNDFDTDGNGNPVLNQITEIQKTRIREALNLWASEIGVQFQETERDGITFALGDTADLRNLPGVPARNFFQLDASVRVDPTFEDSALVFSNQVVFETEYGEDFTRKAVAGIGLILGLNQASDLAAPTILSLDPGFLNASIDQLTDLEPVFPGNTDVLHGQFVHRPDSNDVDLYRFEIDLNDADRVGDLTIETFAERLPDASSLDTTLTLFEEVSASTVTDLGVGSELAITITSLVPGRLGNGATIDFRPTQRFNNDGAVRVLPAFDETGVQLTNSVILDVPRSGAGIELASADQIISAINNDPLASSIFRAELTFGSGATRIVDTEARFGPLRLAGGGIQQISRNDDYFSEDSRIQTSLGAGVYYVGVAASGNNVYDPTLANSGFGGLTQGDYELQIHFEPQVDEVDVIRDLDSDRVGVPGAILDGDGDGTPGGVHNFFFQTRPLNRVVNFTDDGDAVVPGQTVTVTGSNGVVRVFEFVPNGGSPSPGNIAVPFSGGGTGFPTPAGNLASLLQARINAVNAETGVLVSRDGDSLEFEGERSVTFSDDFRGADALGRNIFVDKVAGPSADGSLSNPFNNINNPAVANAFESAIENDIVRIVGNGGLDNDLTTAVDNLSYQIGVADTGGTTLADGRSLEVPRGVTTVIDAGAVFKLRNSFIGIGSTTVQVDRSNGALQVLGTPRLVQLSESGDPVTTTLIGDTDIDGPGYDDGSVIFTSIRDREADVAAANANGSLQVASAGNWGGLVFRRDLDQGVRNLEDEGIFLQRVNHAEIRYGGSSSILVDSVQQLVNPIQIIDMRPTITFNEITLNADSAISAAPNSFEETSYQSPEFQQAGAFRSDYERVGPEIHNNLIVDNSINGLFIRATTTPTEAPREFTIAGRFDDIDIVHYVAENLVVAASPGGSIIDGFAPSLALVSGRSLVGGTLPAGSYDYKAVFVDDDGFESLASTDVFTITVPVNGSSVELTSLPQVEPDGEYVTRRVYRSVAGANDFRLAADIDGSSIGFIDDGTTGDSSLDLTREGIRGRLDASLVLDPGLIVKLTGARIELGQGTQLLAEGLGSNPVVFTSAQDDRFGAGGTFDTNNDNETIFGPSAASRGDWSGIYAGPTSNVSFDNVQLSYAGGISLIQGGLARGFLPLELQQATARVTNSRFEFNDDGQDGAGPAGRLGRLAVPEATILVRGSQPVIVGNTFVDNRGSIIDIDIESLNGDFRIDTGRETGDLDRVEGLDDNFGPLIRLNRYQNVSSPAPGDPGLQLSGLEVRGGIIQTETVFDDTDIAHLVFDNIEVGNFHSSGGLRLLSRPNESLVVKFEGSGNPNSETFGTGLTASGERTATEDRIGGTIHVIGLPGAPVILTSLDDDDAGAGFQPDGSQFTDHDGDGLASRPFANDWRGILLGQFSNDNNVAVVPELELSTEAAPGPNGIVPQFLGELAADELTSDHVRRLGFDVSGFLSSPNDVDMFSFVGSPGSEVFIDIDRTSLGLDTVIELLDEDGNVLARSDNSFAETVAVSPTPVTVFDQDLVGLTTSLQASNEQRTERGAGGLIVDDGSTNIYDAGIHFRLAGDRSDPELRSTYFFRVRSASINPDDASSGLTSGGYRFQARLVEEQEFPGSVVRFADIRYANNGIHVQGLMSSSPLLGEVQENEAAVGAAASNDSPFGATLNQGGQYVGNLVESSNNVIGIGGALSSGNDVDFYQFDVDFSTGTGLQSAIFDIDYADGFNRPDTNISVFFDGDGVSEDNFQPRLIYFGSSSNIADDLTSPGGENDAIEQLLRGSVSNGDPFIGPVNLAEGSYYVAITADGVEPETLLGAIREPINSVDRIVEDRIDRLNPEGFSTADGPVIPRLFTDAAIAASSFSIDTDVQLGHGRPAHFDGTTGPSFFAGAIRIPESTVAQGFDADNDIVPGVAFGTDLEQQDFSIDDDFEIGGDGSFFTGNFEFTATTIPHISVTGSLQNDPADIYQFSVPNTPGGFFQRVIIDIDNGHNALAERDTDNDPATPPVNIDQSSVDTTLVLLQETVPGTLNIVETSTDDFLFGFGANNGAAGSNSSLDPYISRFLAPGNYFVAVLEAGTTFTNDASGFLTDNPNVTGGSQTYTLHVSVEDHALPLTATQLTDGREVLSFDRINNSTSGLIVSESFDLTGYVAADRPTLYFNQIFQPVLSPGADDTATLTLISDQNPTGSLVHTFVASSDYSQVRIALDDFAGDTGIRLQVEYTTNGLLANSAPGSNETGLRLDDFIVGFAERGETIFGTASNPGFVGNGFGAVSGEYQLELRGGTEFATPIGGGTTVLNESFDTNERHNRSVTLITPEGSQLTNGDTFVLGDGAANQVFEFTTTGAVTFGNTPVLFSTTDPAPLIAGRIRAAINSQTAIQIEASTASGQDVAAPTDGRLILSGPATGTFDALASLQSASSTAVIARNSEGHLLFPALLHDGLGDSNFLRRQSQLIIENNVISDVRGIAIYSEPGVRDIDPGDNIPEVVTSNGLLQAPPVGPTFPGAAINLPVLNDSVLGGIAPGIVIQNNTIDNAEFAGIKLDGEIAPWMIIPGNGDEIPDGALLTIDSGGTRVVFEFEDIGDGDPADAAAPGSGTNGGNGYGIGHVPIYYRQTDRNGDLYLQRGAAYTELEVAHAIAEAIQGSILVTNGLAELVDAIVGPSVVGPTVTPPFFGPLYTINPAVYVPGASFIYTAATQGGFQVQQAPLAESAQPFARVVNNTIFGEDGRQAEFSEPANEPNDFLIEAVETFVGNSHLPYSSTSVLGDNDGALRGAGDVDFYRVHLNVGDRLVTNVTTQNANAALGIPEGPNTFLRLFDEAGVEVAATGTGGTTGRDPGLEFFSPVSGTYYVGISSTGNESYDTQSFSGRVQGTGGTGSYTIDIEAFAPRSFVLSLPSSAGGSVTITHIDGSQSTVNVGAEDRVVDVAWQAERAINATPNNRQDPFGAIPAVTAQALGGRRGDGPGLQNLGFLLDPVDFNSGGFGHDRNPFADPDGTTELYVLIENAADVSVTGGFLLDPVPGSNTDQLLNETGVLVTAGASPTILNNVFLNLHESLVVEETRAGGFGDNTARGADNQPKPMEVIVVSNAFQHQGGVITQANSLVTFNGRDTGISTTPTRPSNVNGGTDDFNITLAGSEVSVQFAEGNNFQPAFGSLIIDSAANSLVERAALINLRESVGLPISNVLAPDFDVSGIFRADNEDFVSPLGLGASVFKDRGSSELADTTGPIAVAENPRDNDSLLVDADSAVSFIQIEEGVFESFQVQLRDNGDASDPFAGTGIDDASVVVPGIDGIRSPGANITLFENDRALVEGIDYTFNYDETRNIITLTPLAGIWRDSNAYRIALNNRDRTVLIASDPSAITDGSQFSITDSTGGTVVFEFETGFQLLLPEPLTLSVPTQGTNAGGVRDGDVFVIDDGSNAPITFEYNSDAATLPGTVPVALPTSGTPLDSNLIPGFLNEIALNTQAAIQGQVDAGLLDLDVRVIDERIVLGAEVGATVQTAGSGLLQSARTLALQVPTAGTDPVNGVQSGETFVINNGSVNVIFEFNDGTTNTTGGNIPVDIASQTTLSALEVAQAIQLAVLSSPLDLNAQLIGTDVYLNLPESGSASVANGLLRVVGVSRTPVDGDLINLLPDDGSPVVTFEINRTDEPTGDDGVAQNSIPVNVTRSTTSEELAGILGNAIQTEFISGLSPNDVQSVGGGLLSIGGQQGLGLSVLGSSLEVVGSPAVTGASTIQVFGPLLLNMPAVGGGAIQSGEVILIEDDLGNDILFEYVLNGQAQTFDGSPDANGNLTPVSNVVAFNSFDTSDIVATNLSAVINAAGIGVTAAPIGNGQVSLGRIDDSRVNVAGDLALGIPGSPQITTQRGIVSDQEVLVIRQGDNEVRFEFEEASNGGGVTVGNVAVAFQVGSSVGDVANSLAAAINNNSTNLRVFAIAELDSSGIPTGQVLLNDIPGTVVDVTSAPTLNVIGVPGGAIPVRVTPAFTDVQVRQAILGAINSINIPGEQPATTLSATDRGGASLFVENGTIFLGEGITTFFLPAIQDLSGNPLEANRGDTTEFTILLPGTALDFGDAPDPFFDESGRYPTTLANDGPRHLVDGTLFLGNTVDVDLDGRPSPNADGDDNVVEVFSDSPLISVVTGNGLAEITVDISGEDAVLRDGDLIVINTFVDEAILEFDTDGLGIFDEDHYAISPTTPFTNESIATAIFNAINESPLRPADIALSGDTISISVDDEDGVVLTSEINPEGVLNRGVVTPISVTVTGSGILEAWVDFNGDGDWDDPGEQIIDANTPGAIFSDTGAGVTRVFEVSIPDVIAAPVAPVTTFARFRVSREGGLTPTGLALSGEVEDYALRLLPGNPPALTDAQADRTFTVPEDVALQVLDGAGTLTASQNDDGLLSGVVDPDGQAVAIFPADVGDRTLTTPNGTIAGTFSLASDGTFTFIPEPDFVGTTTFTARVTDINPIDPTSQITNIRAITGTIEVLPVNDPPIATSIDVQVNRAINEDEVQIFDVSELIDPFFIAGPANEASQGLIIQSAASFPDTLGVITNAASTQGGVVEIVNGGTAIQYTPPLNFNGGQPDTFTYVVADQPGPGQVVEQATRQGTVSIAITPVNDPPIAGTDNFSVTERMTLQIPLNGIPGTPGIFDNDSVGPQNEVTTGAQVRLQTIPAQFPRFSFQGGSVDFTNGALVYTPSPFFSGSDSFTYIIEDEFGATATGTVNLDVAGTNDNPIFQGVNGVNGVTSLVLDESKAIPQVFTFDLNTWFSDPEADPLTFTAISEDSTIVSAVLVDSELTIELPSFRPGETALVITADDGQGGSITQRVPVTVRNTPDPPVRIGTLEPLVGREDQTIVADLGTVFADPDPEQLTYTVTRLGNIVNPTQAQISQNPLIASISFSGDNIVIVPEPDQSGVVEIEVSATDGSQSPFDVFTLTITPVADAPITVGDVYNVPVGSQLPVLNPANGLLRNDSDADGDTIEVDLPTVTQPALGTLSVAADGTFTYVNTGGNVGDTDSFTYRAVDSTGRVGQPVTVTLNLNQSSFQNPLQDLAADVTGNGIVSPLDAIRVINFISENGLFTPVSQIGTPPPDFLDVDGNGFIGAVDAILVINFLADRAENAAGELIVNGPAQGELASASFAVTTAFAATSTANLPNSNREKVDAPVLENDARDNLLTTGLEISNSPVAQALDLVALGKDDSAENVSRNIDDALVDLLSESEYELR